MSLNVVHKGPSNIIPALVQTMAWRRSRDKPLPEPMMGLLYWRISESLGLSELNSYNVIKFFNVFILVRISLTWSYAKFIKRI